MGESPRPAREAVIDGVLLALSHSELQQLASGDALRTILNIDYTEIVKADSVVDLQGLWELLSEEPGFDAGAAAAPMCTLKGWSEHFGMDVELPEHLRGLSDREVALKTTECSVPAQEVRRAFEGARRRARRTTSLARELVVEGAVAPGTVSRPMTWRDRAEVGWIASAITAVALVFLGVHSFGECSTAEWKSVDPADYVTGIPVKSAQRFGSQVGAVLGDAAWLARPDNERRDQMESTLRGLDPLNVEVFFIKDERGRIRATAQWFDNKSRVAVRFR